MRQVLARIFRAVGGLFLGAIAAVILVAVAAVVGIGLVVGCAVATGQGRMTVRWRS